MRGDSVLNYLQENQLHKISYDLVSEMRNPITNAVPFVFLFLNNMIENHRHLFYENANPAYADAMPQGDSKSGVVPYAI